MSTATKDWRKEFGLDARKPPQFFSSVNDLDEGAGKAPQPHALRRAFDQLGIEGVLCQERSPVIFFRQVKRIDPAQILKLHHSFWNQGIAPILVIIAPDEVQVYSGLVPPSDKLTNGGEAPGLVETLKRVSDQLRSFLLSVESGEYFRVHKRSFDPRNRVDRDLLRNLQATREDLGHVQAARLEPQTLDALLCRLVFACYLFDRGIIDHEYLETIGIDGAKHLTDILATRPRSDAKANLYTLFGQLGTDFNGDLFSADLEAESRQVKVDHLDILDRFFRGTDIRSGQLALWPYDFGFIPIETISSIYEHFLKAAGEEKKKETGAFYTPRFLAEFVLDVSLEDETSLLDKRFLDPACGSGIFLVGLFNRLAEEWKSKNPGARYDRRAKGLMEVLRRNLYGVDSNRSACQISAFSLYLAFLDQLSPPDIQKLLGKWDRLPHLVSVPGENTDQPVGIIRCADFFTDAASLPEKFDVVVGNPPWGSAKKNSPVALWCNEQSLPHPDRQMAAAFMWKVPIHLKDNGRVCFVLPHGTLFNHSDTAIRFQRAFVCSHAIDRVVNLCDLQRYLFEDSEAPALIVRYRKDKPPNASHRIDYWAPKTGWSITQAELVTVPPMDRAKIAIRVLLDELSSIDGPLIWKERFWATPRDWRLLDRLSLMPRLRDIVGQPGRGASKRWKIAEGFQPLGANDDATKAKSLNLPSCRFVDATAKQLDLFLLENECKTLPASQVTIRSRSNKFVEVFKAPHVLVTKGFSRIAYSDVDVSFRHALRGIHGPQSDRELLMFLAAYLRSDVARFFLFHTSSNWGVSRAEVHVEELLRLPFPLPSDTDAPKRCQAIVQEVAAVMTNAMSDATHELSDRRGIVQATQKTVNKLVSEYFGIDDIEHMLISDTATIIIPSARPSRAKPNVPTVTHSSNILRKSYITLLCDRLNSWAKQDYRVIARTVVDSSIGVGMVVLEKTGRHQKQSQHRESDGDALKLIDQLQRTTSKNHGTFELVRGVKIVDKNCLYITKPLGQRYWTNTAALNDADEIAATILTRSSRERV